MLSSGTIKTDDTKMPNELFKSVCFIVVRHCVDWMVQIHTWIYAVHLKRVLSASDFHQAQSSHYENLWAKSTGKINSQVTRYTPYRIVEKTSADNAGQTRGIRGFFSTNNFEKVERTITHQSHSLEMKITFMNRKRRDSYGKDTFPKALQMKNRLK